MPQGRIGIPAELERAVLVEAGHRCAIPACKQTPVELAHIVPYKDTRSHTFENLIALCPTCHSRYDVTKEIDRPSMRRYKANLGLLNSRYGELERRVLAHFAENPEEETIYLPGGLRMLVMYLMKDGLLEVMVNLVPAIGGGIFTADRYRLTEAGRAFVNNWKDNHPLS